MYIKPIKPVHKQCVLYILKGRAWTPVFESDFYCCSLHSALIHHTNSPSSPRATKQMYVCMRWVLMWFFIFFPDKTTDSTKRFTFTLNCSVMQMTSAHRTHLNQINLHQQIKGHGWVTMKDSHGNVITNNPTLHFLISLSFFFLISPPLFCIPSVAFLHIKTSLLKKEAVKRQRPRPDNKTHKWQDVWLAICPDVFIMNVSLVATAWLWLVRLESVAMAACVQPVFEEFPPQWVISCPHRAN